MIKAKIKNTGQRILVRPYPHEFYDFVCCNEDGAIQGTLLRRDELEIIGDKQEEIIEKAREWIKANMLNYVNFEEGFIYEVDMSDDFCKAIEE